MTTLGEAGFLSDEAESHRQQVEAAHPHLFTLAADYSAYGNRFKNSLEPRNNNTPHLVCAALLARALSNMEGAILLIRRGMRPEANGNLRMLVEATFLLGAVRADRKTADEIIAGESAQLRRVISDYRKLIVDPHGTINEDAWKVIDELSKKLEGGEQSTKRMAVRS